MVKEGEEGHTAASLMIPPKNFFEFFRKICKVLIFLVSYIAKGINTLGTVYPKTRPIIPLPPTHGVFCGMMIPILPKGDFYGRPSHH
jgi:hypothetical protein